MAHRPPTWRRCWPGPTATTVRYDYLQRCSRSSTRAQRYEVVVSQNEFDLEAPVTRRRPRGRPRPGNPQRRDQRPADDARVILARRGAGVQTANPQSGNFKALLAVPILGQPVTIKRGLDRDRRQGARQPAVPLRQHPPGGIRPGGAGAEHSCPAGSELVAPEGPATSSLPVVLVGDLNSDDDTVEAGRPAGLPRAAGSRHGRAQHQRPARLLPRVQPAGRRGRRQRRRLRPPGRPRDDPRPVEVTLESSSVTGLSAGQRLLGLRPRGPLQLPEVPNPLTSSHGTSR